VSAFPKKSISSLLPHLCYHGASSGQSTLCSTSQYFRVQRFNLLGRRQVQINILNPHQKRTSFCVNLARAASHQFTSAKDCTIPLNYEARSPIVMRIASNVGSNCVAFEYDFVGDGHRFSKKCAEGIGRSIDAVASSTRPQNKPSVVVSSHHDQPARTKKNSRLIEQASAVRENSASLGCGGQFRFFFGVDGLNDRAVIKNFSVSADGKSRTPSASVRTQFHHVGPNGHEVFVVPLGFEHLGVQTILAGGFGENGILYPKWMLPCEIHRSNFTSGVVSNRHDMSGEQG